MPDVIIVGGGICGLQLAALLASDGEDVLVLEKLSKVGGRAFLWEKDGFIVDNGIHLIRFGPKSSIAQVFRHIGKKIEFSGLGKSYVGFPDKRVVDFPTGPAGFVMTKMMTIRERLSALSLMIKLKSQSNDALLDTSVEDWMNTSNIKGGLKDYFHLVSASMQVCPFLDRSSVGEMFLNIQSVLKKGYSAMFPTQGWGYIYESLEDTINSNGEIRPDSKVAKVIVEDGESDWRRAFIRRKINSPQSCDKPSGPGNIFRA